LKKGQAAKGIAAACLILDVRLPGVSGLDFQAEMQRPILQRAQENDRGRRHTADANLGRAVLLLVGSRQQRDFVTHLDQEAS
jgi:hypothetical protein